MTYKYNEMPTGNNLKNNTKHNKEYELIKEMLECKTTTSICFTYDDEYEAQKASTIIRKGCELREHKVIVMKRKEKIYVIKEGAIDERWMQRETVCK